MKVRVDGWLQGYPYAHIPDTDYGEYRLGEKQIFGHNLGGKLFGVYDALARAEEIPMTIHTILDEQWHLNVQSMEYAALTVLTNLMLPRVLRHPHPELSESKYKAVYVYAPKDIMDLSYDGLQLLSEQVNSEGDIDHPYNLTQTLSTINALRTLCEQFGSIPNPRNFRMSKDGILTAK